MKNIRKEEMKERRCEEIGFSEKQRSHLYFAIRIKRRTYLQALMGGFWAFYHDMILRYDSQPTNLKRFPMIILMEFFHGSGLIEGILYLDQELWMN